MPEPITVAVSTAEAGSSRLPAARSMPTPRHRREKRFRELVQRQRLLSTRMVELTLHGAADADAVAQRLVDIENELKRSFAVRWRNLRQKLLLKESELWAEPHAEHGPCAGCKILSYLTDESVTVPAPRRMWE